MNKDVQLYSQFAEEAGTPNRMGTQVAKIWQQTEDSLPTKSDFTLIYKVLESSTRS